MAWSAESWVARFPGRRSRSGHPGSEKALADAQDLRTQTVGVSQVGLPDVDRDVTALPDPAIPHHVGLALPLRAMMLLAEVLDDHWRVPQRGVHTNIRSNPVLPSWFWIEVADDGNEFAFTDTLLNEATGVELPQDLLCAFQVREFLSRRPEPVIPEEPAPLRAVDRGSEVVITEQRPSVIPSTWSRASATGPVSQAFGRQPRTAAMRRCSRGTADPANR